MTFKMQANVTQIYNLVTIILNRRVDIRALDWYLDLHEISVRSELIDPITAVYTVIEADYITLSLEFGI